MATPVIMPRQGQSVESCIIAEWKKKKGDEVAIGDVLFSYETDKASFEETAKVGGTLLEVFFEEGDDVPCLLNVCVIGTPGEDCSEFNPNAGESAPAEAEAAPTAQVAAAAAPSAEMCIRDRNKITQTMRFRQAVMEYSLKHGVTKAAIRYLSLIHI